MSPGYKSPPVREIEILRDQKTLFRLGRVSYIDVAPAAKSLVPHGVRIQSKRSEARTNAMRNVLVQLDLHATLTSWGAGVGAGRSSLAEAAANATTTRTSSSVTLGKSAKIVAAVSPCAR
jgi:hypothetical protein